MSKIDVVIGGAIVVLGTIEAFTVAAAHAHASRARRLAEHAVRLERDRKRLAAGGENALPGIERPSRETVLAVGPRPEGGGFRVHAHLPVSPEVLV
ncbi:hypothetical protein HS041_15815 [Planomonospora sp. ID67723]|uniref:hypothetical protein n=1 Tax=Planomonospora sp. ID67723 TaxID=2738134 RepID=UPI0018C3C538|nr:hypothetical protein [Planomonospora sp. ID67723]MBG0829235.1 hypothetical protein [Planomonospora sp. ID67723]